VDSLEGVTHALRTTEYNDRDEQYQWIQATLGLRRVRIHSFSRMNFMYTELSKRKLAWFVENGHVTGWDDARFPTVRGVVRRGINITALRNFMYAQGASRRIVNMEWGKFWAENKKEIDKLAKRFMAIDKTCNVVLHVTNGPSGNSLVTTPYHPKNPDMGQRVVRISNKVLLETIDVEGMMEGEEIVLMRWGVVKVTKITTQEMWGTFVPDGNVKAAKRKLSWMAVGDNKATTTPCTLMEFDNLITKEKLEEGDNFQDHINPNTMASTEAIGDAGLKTLQHHEVIQLERRGYYRVDRPYMSEDKPLILFMVPDGKTKSMGGLTGKLAHR
jgi:glutamyl-tRNA synthetase